MNKTIDTLTEVRHTNTAGEVEEFLAIPKGDIRAFALRHHALDDASDTLGDVLLAELDQGSVVGAS